MPNTRTYSEAARWHARLASGASTPQERSACLEWQQASTEHEQAFADAERLTTVLRQLHAFDPRMQALANAALEMPPDREAPVRQPTRRRFALGAGLAAALALVMVSAHLLTGDGRSAEVATYQTAVGETRRLELADGSVVHLDTDSRLAVSMQPHERRLELIAGRALFEVAHDSSRPFSVAAGAGRVVALGTRFQVQREERRVIVTLEEGSVAVQGIGPAAARETRLQPGEQLSFVGADGSGWSERRVDTELVTSWSRGRNVFRATPLAQAVEQINRYATRKIRIGDPALSDLPVSGTFLAGDSDVIVAAMTAVLPLRGVGKEDEIVLLARAPEHTAGDTISGRGREQAATP